jgi:hypothetical protein
MHIGTSCGAVEYRPVMGPSLHVPAVVAVVLMCCSIVSSVERLRAQECEDLGFTEVTLCFDCNPLTDFVKDRGTCASSAGH